MSRYLSSRFCSRSIQIEPSNKTSSRFGFRTERTFPEMSTAYASNGKHAKHSMQTSFHPKDPKRRAFRLQGRHEVGRVYRYLEAKHVDDLLERERHQNKPKNKRITRLFYKNPRIFANGTRIEERWT